jgi:hypothetical protein
MNTGRSLALACIVLACSLLTASPTRAATVTLTVQPATTVLGGQTTVAGAVEQGSAPVPGATLVLRGDPYPFKDPRTLASTVSAADGSFHFAPLSLTRNTHLQVLAGGTAVAASQTIEATVAPRPALAVHDLGPGRVRLSLRLAHAPGLRSPSVSARWYLAAPGQGFQQAAVTSTSELPGAVTYTTATVDPPARRFRYRVCLVPAWMGAMGPPRQGGACPSAGLLYSGQGSGQPLPPFPSTAAVAAAARFLAGRAGRTSFAILDSSGRLSGLNVREHFETASVVKVMFLTAYLQRLAAANRRLDSYDRSLLYPMIHESNNEDASAVLGIVGQEAVERVAREAGMQDYAPGVGWWAYSQTSAGDQARFFAQLHSLIPAGFYGYARELLSTIEPSQSWGVPPVARPDWQVYFKTGALPSQGLFNEVALLQRGDVSFTLAVFTDGEPSMEYGEQTIAGVAQRLLGD